MIFFWSSSATRHPTQNANYTPWIQFDVHTVRSFITSDIWQEWMSTRTAFMFSYTITLDPEEGSPLDNREYARWIHILSTVVHIQAHHRSCLKKFSFLRSIFSSSSLLSFHFFFLMIKNMNVTFIADAPPSGACARWRMTPIRLSTVHFRLIEVPFDQHRWEQAIEQVFFQQD